MYKFNDRTYALTNTWIREDSTRVRDYTNGVDYIETMHVNNYSIPAYKHTYPTESISTGSGNTMMTTFRYPQEVSATELGAAQAQSVLNSMVTKNLLSTPLIVKGYKNGIINTEVKTFQGEYNTNVSGTTMILPRYIYVKKGGNAAVEDRKITFDSYDAYGNLTQYTLENGIPVSVIWGYNKTMPIAKIEGALLSAIPSSAIETIVNSSNADNNYSTTVSADQTELDLVNVLDTFRKGLSGYQVTTYSYDPLIGVRSVTPPSGQREYYTYDSAGRLQEVKRIEKDASGNEVFRVLKKNEYHYQQP
jgi:YD repeat-containing protein